MTNNHNDPNYVGKHDALAETFVNTYWRTHFHSPTYKEISDACGMNSTCVAQNVVARLARHKQWVVKAHGARCITPGWVIAAIQTSAIDFQNEKA